MSKDKTESKSGLATAGMVLGIIAIVGAWIPFLNIVSIIIGVLAIVSGGVALIQRRSIGKAITALVLGIATIIIAVVILNAASEAIDEALQPTQTSESSQVEAQKIDVKTLGDAFNANQVAAEKEWGGKFVEFSAEITNINDGRLSFSKNVDSEDFSMTQISCELKDKDQALNVENGQTITVQGVIGDQLLGVISLKDCNVL